MQYRSGLHTQMVGFLFQDTEFNEEVPENRSGISYKKYTG